MKIIADQEGAKAVQELCDVALKAGGIGNLVRVQSILASVVREAPEPKPAAKKKKAPPKTKER